MVPGLVTQHSVQRCSSKQYVRPHASTQACRYFTDPACVHGSQRSCSDVFFSLASSEPWFRRSPLAAASTSPSSAPAPIKPIKPRESPPLKPSLAPFRCLPARLPIMATLLEAFAASNGKVITCKAAVAYEMNQPLVMELIHVAPPGPREVRVKITHGAVCFTDVFYMKGKDPEKLFPRIFGHEGAGFVESVGSAIKEFAVGDKVIPVWCCECRNCKKCKRGKSNICETLEYNWSNGFMPSDRNATRFTRASDGQPIFHFFGTSTFSQYTVCDEACVAKISPDADLSKVCLLGCGVPTGIGSAWNIAKVDRGSTVVVFGLGTIGYAVVEACKVAGASRIIGVDIEPKKLKKGLEFGVTDPLDSTKLNRPVEDVIKEMTDGEGVDYSFDCTGNPGVIMSAMESANAAGGVAVILGLMESSKTLAFHPGKLLWGKTWTSGLYGGYKGKTQLPDLVEKCVGGVINLDHYITHRLPFSQINKAVELLEKKDCLRCVMDYDS